MNHPKHLWHKTRSSFWGMPALIVAGSIVLAMVLIAADTAGSGQWQAHLQTGALPLWAFLRPGKSGFGGMSC